METDTMTADDNDDASGTTPTTDPAITDAESVLDGLLDVVRSQAEDILAAARVEAAAAIDNAKASGESQRQELVDEARRDTERIRREADEAAATQRSTVLAVVEATLAELGRIDGYRADLEALAQQIREADITAPTTDQFIEVNPEALQMLAGELGEDSCREVIDTFVAELAVQLETLADVTESDDVKSKKVSRILHNLSSGCATVGASDLASLCGKVTPETLSDHLDELVRRGRTVRAEVIRLRESGLSVGAAGDDAT